MVAIRGRGQRNSGYIVGRGLTGLAKVNLGRHERDVSQEERVSKGEVRSSVHTSLK